MIYIDHESLKHLNGQGKLNHRHSKWVEFIESFPYVIKYKQVKDNIIVDSLSRRYPLITTPSSKFLGFEHIKEMYANHKDFYIIFHACEHYAFQEFHKYDDFILKDSNLCVPKCFIKELLVHEAHSGGLTSHFGVTKTVMPRDLYA